MLCLVIIEAKRNFWWALNGLTNLPRVLSGLRTILCSLLSTMKFDTTLHCWPISLSLSLSLSHSLTHSLTPYTYTHLMFQLDDEDLPHHPHHPPHPHNPHHSHTHPHPHPLPSTSPDLQSSNPSTAVVTIIADPPQVTDSLMPEAKRLKLTPPLPPSIGSKPPVIAGLMGNGGISHNNSQGLSRSEVDAVKQLITGE